MVTRLILTGGVFHPDAVAEAGAIFKSLGRKRG